MQVRDKLYEEWSLANQGKKSIFVFLLELLFSFVGVMKLTITTFNELCSLWWFCSYGGVSLLIDF